MATIIAKRGDRGAKVRVAQKLLRLVPDGIYGPLTEEAVRDFQRAEGLEPDGIIGVRTWQKMLPFAVLPTRRAIRELIVHCSATVKGKDFTVDDLRQWHKQQGWADIGYHYVVHLDGTIHEGRPVDKVGAHCTNHNTRSIGICYIGGLGIDGKTPEDTRTEQQKDSLQALLVYLKCQYPLADIYGHRDLSPDKNGNGTIEPQEWVKSCPSFDARREYRDI